MSADDAYNLVERVCGRQVARLSVWATVIAGLAAALSAASAVVYTAYRYGKPVVDALIATQAGVAIWAIALSIQTVVFAVALAFVLWRLRRLARAFADVSEELSDAADRRLDFLEERSAHAGSVRTSVDRLAERVASLEVLARPGPKDPSDFIIARLAPNPHPVRSVREDETEGVQDVAGQNSAALSP